MAMRRPLIAGNWKMFGRKSDLGEIEALAMRVAGRADGIEALICPPAPLIGAALAVKCHPVVIGAQDCSAVAEDAARTGEVSAAMLADVGARYVIVGHSERRSLHGESDALIRRKAQAAQAAGLTPIVCVGETQAERAAGRIADVVGNQVKESVPTSADAVVVAYEPVWAIGGDSTPTSAEIAEVHQLIRETLTGLLGSEASGVRILYGGSVGPKNAGEIFTIEGVDGALVGRSSLKAADFAAIILAHPAAG
jgi:triosephosphate isomerase